MDFERIFGLFSSERVRVYADFIDPFSYIGFHNLRQAAEARNITIEWRGFEFNPATPPEGLLLATNTNSDLRPGMWASVRAYAERSALNLREPQFVPSTQHAQQVLRQLPNGAAKNALIENFFRAYFVEGKDLGQPEVLRAAAAMAAPQWDERIARALASPAKRDELEKDRQAAQERQFAGMPGFLYRGKTHFGALSATAWENIFSHNTRSKELACSIK